jgi:hypothetical protein
MNRLVIWERRNLVTMKCKRYASYCATILVLLVLLSGCAAANSRTILAQVPLQSQLATQYGGSNIVVDLQNGNTLGVTVSGSLSEDLDQDRAKEQARQIATSVCQYYAAIDRIDRVWVAFERRRDGLPAAAAVSVTFTFEKGTLECGGR